MFSCICLVTSEQGSTCSLYSRARFYLFLFTPENSSICLVTLALLVSFYSEIKLFLSFFTPE